MAFGFCTTEESKLALLDARLWVWQWTTPWVFNNKTERNFWRIFRVIFLNTFTKSFAVLHCWDWDDRKHIWNQIPLWSLDHPEYRVLSGRVVRWMLGIPKVPGSNPAGVSASRWSSGLPELEISFRYPICFYLPRSLLAYECHRIPGYVPNTILGL